MESEISQIKMQDAATQQQTQAANNNRFGKLETRIEKDKQEIKKEFAGAVTHFQSSLEEKTKSLATYSEVKDLKREMNQKSKEEAKAYKSLREGVRTLCDSLDELYRIKASGLMDISNRSGSKIRRKNQVPNTWNRSIQENSDLSESANKSPRDFDGMLGKRGTYEGIVEIQETTPAKKLNSTFQDCDFNQVLADHFSNGNGLTRRVTEGKNISNVKPREVAHLLSEVNKGLQNFKENLIPDAATLENLITGIVGDEWLVSIGLYFRYAPITRVRFMEMQFGQITISLLSRFFNL